MVRGRPIIKNNFFGIRIGDIGIGRDVITGDHQDAPASNRASGRGADLITVELLFVRVTGGKATLRSPLLPTTGLSRAVMSRNGVGSNAPFLMMRIRPGCSTTNNLPLPSRADATCVG